MNRPRPGILDVGLAVMAVGGDAHAWTNKGGQRTLTAAEENIVLGANNEDIKQREDKL